MVKNSPNKTRQATTAKTKNPSIRSQQPIIVSGDYTQVYNPHNDTYALRDPDTGQIVKVQSEPFPGVRKEK